MMTKITAEQVLADFESLSRDQKQVVSSQILHSMGFDLEQPPYGFPKTSTKQAPIKKKSIGYHRLLMDGELIDFKKGYLETHEDLWMLKALVGSQAVMESLKQTKRIDDTFVENLMAKCRIEFHTNERHTYLFSTRSELLEFDFGPLLPVKPLNALKVYGLQKLEDASEKMYTKI